MHCAAVNLRSLTNVPGSFNSSVALGTWFSTGKLRLTYSALEPSQNGSIAVQIARRASEIVLGGSAETSSGKLRRQPVRLRRCSNLVWARERWITAFDTAAFLP